MQSSIYRWDHSPAQHFGQVAYDFLAAKITDWRGAPGDDDNMRDVRADMDRRVLALLLRDAPQAKKQKRSNTEGEPREEMLKLCGERIGWHRALPELKCWAGQATLLSTVAARVEALGGAPPEGVGLLDWTVPLKTCSGIDARVAPNGLDDGFSVAQLGMPIYTYAACELLAVLGMAITPIVRYGYRCYGYVDRDGQWWQFRVVEREGYHRCYTISQKSGVNGTP
jgi:hypothetical protein